MTTPPLCYREQTTAWQWVFYSHEKNRLVFGWKQTARFTIQQLQGGKTTVGSKDGISSLRASFQQQSSSSPTEQLRGSARLHKSSQEAAELQRRVEMNLSGRAAAGWRSTTANTNPGCAFWTFIAEKKKKTTKATRRMERRFHIHPDAPPRRRLRACTVRVVGPWAGAHVGGSRPPNGPRNCETRAEGRLAGQRGTLDQR